MSGNNQPELIDWHDDPSGGNRLSGIIPALALGSLSGAALIGAFGPLHSCYPRAYAYHHWRNYYTCSPKYVCQPVPYWPGL